MTILGPKRKHVYGQIDFAFDFANNLASGETLNSGETVIVRSASHGAITDLTLGTPTISGTEIQVRISGGTALAKVADDCWETEYALRAEVITSSGEREVLEGILTTFESAGTGS